MFLISVQPDQSYEIFEFGTGSYKIGKVFTYLEEEASSVTVCTTWDEVGEYLSNSTKVWQIESIFSTLDDTEKIQLLKNLTDTLEEE